MVFYEELVDATNMSNIFFGQMSCWRPFRLTTFLSYVAMNSAVVYRENWMKLNFSSEFSIRICQKLSQQQIDKMMQITTTENYSHFIEHKILA